ncbi:hypothetical protein [Massilia puerhi]|uniref:hypothetical protein n=1 Tax=Massilia puerhi TaxID=2681550 RepID=UPI001E2A6086|nr:hypothetical protein [Massilia puerhi]
MGEHIVAVGQALETQLANAGAHLTIDSNARLSYSREIKKMAEQLRREAVSGKITWASAAQQAYTTRNLIMEIIRGKRTLSTTQKNRIFAELVAPAGKSNPAVNQAMSRLSYAGRGLLLASLSLSAYNIATSNNKISTRRN